MPPKVLMEASPDMQAPHGSQPIMALVALSVDCAQVPVMPGVTVASTGGNCHRDQHYEPAGRLQDRDSGQGRLEDFHPDTADKSAL